jgi:DNA-binding transcriptional ArsR family regulator
VPLNPASESSAEDQVERLYDLSADEILADLEITFGGALPEHWRDVARRPGRWLQSYAAAAAQTWSAIRPIWQQAQSLLNREVERVGAAVVRGNLDVVLGSIHSRAGFSDGALKIWGLGPDRYDLAGRPLVLVPMLSGEHALICNFDLPDAVWLGYPVPGIGEFSRGSASPASRGDTLGLLLGPVRAQVLNVLTRPLTVGELATAIGLPPSAITYHSSRLAAVGLVERKRYGKEVRVSRTSRAEGLAELFQARPNERTS